MSQLLQDERRKDAEFRLAGDGVHINETGHWIIAQAILRHWGVQPVGLGKASDRDAVFRAFPHGSEMRTLVGERQAVLRDSWLTATGHNRPGMSRGLPLPDAAKRAQEIDAESRRLLKPGA